MKSNYDILGNQIRLIDTRNRESITDRVLGINIDKFFMPSVANVIGTDLSKYKLITKGKFACNPMHVGRDERLPVALYDEEEPAIVSPAYFMFEVIDNSILNEDYLMMWFRRPEFDRICWLHTDGSVRGGITWDDICRLELPIPPIEKQLEIVNSYKAITERIALKQKINDNLVAIGTTSIQKNVGRGALINLTEAEMDRLTFPKDFKVENVSEFCVETKSGSTPSRTTKDRRIYYTVRIDREFHKVASKRHRFNGNVWRYRRRSWVSCNRSDNQSGNMWNDLSFKSQSSLLIFLAYSKPSGNKQTFQRWSTR